MAKKVNSTPKIRDSKSGVSERRNIGDKVSPKAWQPITDRTTTPPKGGNDKK